MPTIPDEVQVIVGVVLLTQDSPPFGEMTTIDPFKVKLLLLVSEIAGLVVLVIRIRKSFPVENPEGIVQLKAPSFGVPDARVKTVPVFSNSIFT